MPEDQSAERGAQRAKSKAQSAGRRTPSALLLALAALLASLAWLWFRLIDHLRIEWSVNPQYAYGWAVPFLCVYLLWQKVMRQAPSERREGQSAEGRVDAWRFPLPALLLFALLAFLYAPTRLVQEANPEWRLISWALAFIVIGLTLLFLSLLKPQASSAAPSPHPSPPVGERVSAGPVRVIPSTLNSQLSTRLAFPFLFFLVAVPWPTLVEGRLIQWLTGANVAVTIELLNMFGIPAIQHGSVIEISTGVVGVDEACSGIRSFQATLMISLFFGELYSLTALRRVFCVLLGFALSFIFNVARTFLLTYVASKQGVPAIDKWHDPAGVTVLVWCFVALWLAALMLKRYDKDKGTSAKGKEQSAERGGVSPVVSVGPPEASPSALRPPSSDPRASASISGSSTPSTLNPQPSTIRAAALGLIAWLVIVEVGVESWYRSHEKNVPATTAWSAAFPTNAAAFSELPFTEKTQQFLRYDAGRNCAWQEDDGTRWQGIYLRWNPGKIAVHLARSHTPEVCLSAAGRKMVAKSDLRTFEVNGLQLPFVAYLFEGQNDRVHVFYCLWEDRAVRQGFDTESLTYRSRLAPVLAGRRNSGQRTLELAVWGIADEQQAEAALQRQLKKIIRVEP